MYDIVFKHGRVVDGTRNPWFRADVAVAKGKIAAVSRHVGDEAERVIDASGLVIAPGFIDLHTHTDRSILTNKRATSSVMAGVTTEGVGNCGSSAYCFTPEYLDNMRARVPDLEVDWTDLKGYRERLEAEGVGINLAPFVGHNTIRTCFMGPEDMGGERTIPTEAEMEGMKGLLDEAMAQGAFGLTTGLWYAPGRNALTEEVVELCRVAAGHGGVYMSHIRGEADVLIESTVEFIEICERAGIRGCISHHKAMGPQNWGKPGETMRLLERARKRGVEVMCDLYPWNYSSAANLGRWFISGWGRNRGIEGHYVPDPLDLKTFLDDLRDPELWSRIKKEAQERYDVEVEKNEERRRALAKHGIKPSEIVDPRSFEYVTHSKTHPKAVGRRFFEVAEALGMDDHWEAIREVLLDDDGETFTGGGGMCDEDIATILRFSACAVSTDSSTRDSSSTTLRPAHPRDYGSFAKVLGKYVREEGLLSLEDAVRKMTSLPASFLGLQDRGAIRPGAWADLTVFDAEEIENRSTFGEPDRYPSGIKYVLVNGVVAAEEGGRTEGLSGKVLVHESAPQ
ncbi:MAG: D-aminoacylase [Candidatus Bathyarchaeota archaeon]|nr:D-aminoacylase [Candidatus Bathyarchaeota archaeon]